MARATTTQLKMQHFLENFLIFQDFVFHYKKEKRKLIKNFNRSVKYLCCIPVMQLLPKYKCIIRDPHVILRITKRTKDKHLKKTKRVSIFFNRIG